jgi:hypothetical protein
MWGQLWGSMIFTGVRAVPALNFWLVLLLGALLGIVAVHALRGARPRTIGIAVLALALVIPITARAVPFVFTNGSTADATQVNADFNSLTPVTGFFEVPQAAVTGQENVLGPAFTAPRAMTCIVSEELDWLADPGQPNGVTASASEIKSENGGITPAMAPPANQVSFVGLQLTNAGYWQSNQTRLFTVASGASVQFGSQIQANGSVPTSHYLLVLVYSCQ